MGKTFLGLLLSLFFTAPLLAESPLAEYPQGLGLGGGAASGVGFSYRHLDEQWGWQVTGIAYRAPGSQGGFFGSLGAGVQKPLAIVGFDILHVVPYLTASAAVHAGTASSTGFGIAPGAGFGFEFLAFSHFSLNLEVLETIVWAGDNETGSWEATRQVMVLPQAALYFRF